MQKLDLGFSIADGGYPSLAASPGTLSVSFRTSTGADASLTFSSVAAFSWQEGELLLSAKEPWDGACELNQSSLLSAHPTGATMHGGAVPRHLRFRFHPWGTLDVVCGSYVAAA